MKKQILLLIAGGMIGLASCSSNNNQSASQAQIDSMVNVKTGEMQATMQAKNDSTINALAKAKADSITAAKGTTKEIIRVEERRDHHEGHHGGNNDQGYNNPPAGSVNNRPGATNATNGNGNVPPKSVNDRPGATNSR